MFGRRRATEPEALVSAVATAQSSLQVIEDNAREVADAFRWEQIAEASRGLNDVMAGMRTVLELVEATSRAVSPELSATLAVETRLADDELHEVVNQMLTCHEDEDWLAVADTLDQDFVAMLATWRGVFESLRCVLETPPPYGDAA